MNTLQPSTAIDASTLHRVIEPPADFICAADQPRIALASALRFLLDGVEHTNRVGRCHLESVRAGASATSGEHTAAAQSPRRRCQIISAAEIKTTASAK